MLSGLAALPLVGGSVALIGAPTAVAYPASPSLLNAYKTWLDFEHRFLSWQMAADPRVLAHYHLRPDNQGMLFRVIKGAVWDADCCTFHDRNENLDPYDRAALVLSAVGAELPA